MPSRRAITVAVAALLLGALPLVAAHGDEHNGESMDMNAHEAPQPQTQDNSQPGSYWSLSEHATLMYWHIGLEIVAWIIILPIGQFKSFSLYYEFELTFQSCNAEYRALAVHLTFATSFSRDQCLCARSRPRLQPQDPRTI